MMDTLAGQYVNASGRTDIWMEEEWDREASCHLYYRIYASVFVTL